MIENVERIVGNPIDESMSIGKRERVHTSDPTHEILLPGCSPIPLANYLKALGILRLVAEQADPDARGYWRNDAFTLIARLDVEALQRFFLEKYLPTPVLAPWNGGSGFFYREEKLDERDPVTGKKIKSGRRTESTTATRTVDELLSSASRRLAGYREAILVAKKLLNEIRIEEAVKGAEKDELLALLRSELPDQAVQCMDAALVLTESKTQYPPLLGTGGTDGNLDFTNNFMQRVLAVIDPQTDQATSASPSLLQVALFGEVQPGLCSDAIGQFAPGFAGGVNQTVGFGAKPLANPWDFILMIEGALLFAAAATRRLEHGTGGALSYPFTVRATAAGFGAAALPDETNARAEIWMPLWETPTTLAELKALLAEGRVTLGRRHARDGLDFARAVAKLGVERGISSFQRYAFLMRSGKAYFATPLNRFVAKRNRFGDIIDELEAEGWLSKFRQFGRGDGSARLSSLVRRLEDALFTLAGTQGGDPNAVQQALIVLGEIQRYFATSPKAREACPSIPLLSEQWASRADDGSPEFDLAAGLACLHAYRRLDDGGTQRIMPMRAHLAPEKREYGRLVWDKDAGHQVTWGSGGLENNLVDTLQRRLLEAARLQLADKPFEFDHASSLTAVAAWLGDTIDEGRLAALVPGLMLARIPYRSEGKSADENAPLPAAYRLLKPFFCTDAQLRRAKLLSPDGRLPARADLVRRLEANRTAEAVDLAVRWLRANGIAAVLGTLRRGSADFSNGRRLLAALLVPIGGRDLEKLLPKSSTQE